MAHSSFVQTDFRGGIWSPSAQGKMRDPNYARALNESLNSYPLVGAAWVRRPPFRALGYTRFGLPSRLVGLDGRTTNYYNLEFSDGHLRAIQGPQFVTDATRQSITGITSEKPAIVATETAHGWVTGDTVILDLQGDAATEFAIMTSRVFRIEYLTATTFALHDLITDQSIDGTIGAWDTAFEGYVSKLTDLETPYTGETWRAVRRVQSDKATLLLHPAFWPRTLSYIEAGGAAWADAEIDFARFKDGPYLDPVPGSTVTPSALTGIVALTFGFEAWSATKAYDEGDYVTGGTYHWRSLRDENVNQSPATGSQYWERVSALNFMPRKSFSAGDIGRHVRLFSEPPEYATASTYADGDIVKHLGVYWKAIAAVSAGGGSNEPGASVDKWAPYAAGARWTWGKIVSTNGTGSLIAPGSQTGYIGNMTSGGGLGKLFDQYTNTQLDTASAQHLGTSAYGGLNLASGTVISSARVWPSRSATSVSILGSSRVVIGNPIITGLIVNPFTFGNFVATYTFQAGGAANVIFNLRGKATAPGSASDGTLLGTSGTIPYSAVTSSPITITSNDNTTAWNYVWIEMVGTSASGSQQSMRLCASQMEFFSGAVVGNGISVQILGKPLLYTGTDSITTWRLGRYNSNDPEYPICGVFHQGRFWLATPTPGHFDASKAAGDPFDFAPTEEDGTVTDASAISYTFNTAVKAPIHWMHSQAGAIVMGTPAGEVRIFSDENGAAITPTSIKEDLVTNYGSKDIEPVQTPLTLLFVHANGQDVQEFFKDAYSGKYTGPSLSDNAKDLTAPGILQIAYQQGLNPIMWACTYNGDLVGATYARTDLIGGNPPDYNAWHRHEHGNASRKFSSVSVGPSIDGTGVALAAITVDTETGLCRIEVQSDLIRENNDIFDCDFLDGMYVPASGGTFGIASDTPDEVPVVPPDPPPPGEPQWRVPGWSMTSNCDRPSGFSEQPDTSDLLTAHPGAIVLSSDPADTGVYITGPTTFGGGQPCNFGVGFTSGGNVPGFAGYYAPAAGATEFKVLAFQLTAFSLYKWFGYQSWSQDVGATDPWTTPVWS